MFQYSQKDQSSGVLNLWQQVLCAAVSLFFAFTWGGAAFAQSPPDNPLLHKDAAEISVRLTEVYMLPHTALLSTAAIRYGLVLKDAFGKGWRRGSLEYTLDWLPAVVLTKPRVIYCGGVAPLGVRWNVIAKPRLRPYGEVVTGGVLCTGNIPPSDLNVGFTINASAGLALFTRDNQMLTAGLDYSHLSNAYLGRNNPNYNGIAFVLEYHWLKPVKPK